MTQTAPGVKVRACLVQKAIKERKQSLMARARSSLGITTPDPLPLASLPSLVALKRAAPDEPGEHARKVKSKVLCYNTRRKTRSMGSLLCDEAPKKGSKGDNRVDPELELEHCQLEIQSGNEESSPNSNTRLGEDSYQLYKACLLPRDEIALASMPHSKLEEIAAHDLMRAVAVVHQLTLRSKKLHEDLEEKAREKERVESEAIANNEERLRTLECQLTKLKAWGDDAEKALLKSKLEIERLTQHGQESFEAGRAAGRLEMADSEEFRSAIRQARVSGAKDYLTSPTFELILSGKAAEHEVIGFLRCQSQALELGGFKEGFDLGLLDPAMAGSLEPAAAEIEEENAGGDGDVEFGNLEGEKD